MDLAFSEFEEKRPGCPVIIAHGLFGSRSNWRSIASRLADTNPVFTVDLRNHGESPHSAVMNYQAMAQDLEQFALRHCHGRAHFVGHSMGGKAVMALAASSSVAQRLAVIDIAPRNYHNAEEHLALTDAMMSLRLDEVQRRSDADDQLARTVENAGIRQFLLQSLIFDDGHYRWRLNLPVLAQAMGDISGFPSQLPAADNPALFVYGTASDYLLPSDHDLVRALFPQAELVSVAGASHWLHAEYPDQVTTLLRRHLVGDCD